MARYIRTALILSLIVSVRSDEQLEAYRRHEALLRQYPCGTPQPRVFELEQVIGADVLQEKTRGNLHWIKPATTVLHRCISSGCCQIPREKCMPSKKEDVKLTFLITSSTLDYLEVDAVNHTRCACTTV
uniref:Platelet-derived growth factor (PDGF) family profile domain-containing protein n=1 Tax=Anoplophora glabripennis TaxID=217634 RepID=V5I7U4_ANOGL